MSVRCTVLGHVCDSTEFEERRVERPEGTVLVCREYQVCRHCGNREEMYRNEQVLVSRESDAATSEAGTADPEPTATETSADESDDERVDIEEQTETASGSSGESESDVDRQEERTAPETAGETDDQVPTDTDGPEPRLEGAESPTHSAETGSDGAAREAISDGSGTTAVTDDAVILTDSPEQSTQWPSDTDTWPTGSDTTARDRETERRSSPDNSATSEGDTGAEVLTDSDATAGTDEKHLECRTCGTEWHRKETSLRDGDLCPDCRGGYVRTTEKPSTARVE